ncbi:MAG: isochorismatase family protein, partial [Gammaproteobacteria bacterium]
MELSNKTAREIYADVKANPTRKKFGFGSKAALINVDVQKAYTRTDLFSTAYENDPNQILYINEVAALFRQRDWPVVWTYCVYVDSGEDCGVWGTRSDTPDSLQNIKYGSERAELDDRLEREASDLVIDKKMPSEFHDTRIGSLLTFKGVDT